MKILLYNQEKQENRILRCPPPTLRVLPSQPYREAVVDLAGPPESAAWQLRKADKASFHCLERG